MYTKSISVIGLGYIGLPTAITLAQNGVQVTGTDLDGEKVKLINKGISPIKERGLSDALKSEIKRGNFAATSEYIASDIYIVAVPTPVRSDFSVDLTFVFRALQEIAPLLSGGELIIFESTMPPNTTQKLADYLLELRPEFRDTKNADGFIGSLIHFAHCPERVLSGNALEELVINDRIIGGLTPKAAEMATEVYQSFCKGKLHTTDSTTAELVKLTENAFRDVNIAFANELSIICDNLGINVWELVKLANHHPRVNVLQPGPGVGGHCIAVDPWFIIAADPDNAQLMRSAREVNSRKSDWVVEKINQSIAINDVACLTIFGISFKADIDDLRESPSLQIALEVATNNPKIEVLIVEPNIEKLPEQLANLRNVKLVGSETAIQKSQILTFLVDHQEFKEYSAEMLSDKTVLDFKGIWPSQT